MPQSVDQRVDVLKIIDLSSPVQQIIDVPKIISQDNIPQRAVLRVPQLADVPVPRVINHERGHGSGKVLGR